MDYAFPEKYYKVAKFCDHEFGDLETAKMLSDQQKLILYALRQQAEHGPCTGKAPSLFRTYARAKYDAWKQVSHMSKYEAMVRFVKYVEECLGGEVNWVKRLEALEEKEEDKDKKNEGDVAGSSFVAKTDNAGNITCADDDQTWDDDLRLHSEPTVQNVHYLISQVMKLRRQLRDLQEAARRDEIIDEHKDVAQEEQQQHESHKIITVRGNSVTSLQAVLVPPEKPIGVRRNNPRSVNSSAHQMTLAALESARRTLPTQNQKEMGWAEWLGLV